MDEKVNNFKGKRGANGFEKNPQNINKNGRPKSTISELLDELTDAKSLSFQIEFTDQNGEKHTRKGKFKTKKSIKEMIAAQLIQKAVKGDLKAIREFLDRTEGKPQQKLDIDQTGEIYIGYE
jgi:hypothetical protein